MSKRVDHDATQEVSSSQLVPDRKPPVYPNVANNDASMWLSAPVSADDFASGPKKKPDTQHGRRAVVALTVLALVGVGAAGTWYAFLRPAATETSALATPPSAAPVPAAAPTTGPDSPAIANEPASDAGVAVVVDAAAPVAETAGTLEVDAISAADPAPKKSVKKRPVKKKRVVTKKAATPKRR
jgi:hypothetical protein